MSYGLNSLLKKILPKGLFYRALIIVATPVVLLQLTISVVFFDSIWIKANKGMTKSLVSEVKTLFDAYRSEETKDVQFLTNLYKKNFDFVINIKKKENLPKTKSDRRFSPMDRSLRREMKDVFGNQLPPLSSIRPAVQIRQMGTLTTHQRQGHAGTILIALEEAAVKAWGNCTGFLQARVAAIPFYQSLGWVCFDGEYVVDGIGLHCSMWKELKKK